MHQSKFLAVQYKLATVISCDTLQFNNIVVVHQCSSVGGFVRVRHLVVVQYFQFILIRIVTCRYLQMCSEPLQLVDFPFRHSSIFPSALQIPFEKSYGKTIPMVVNQIAAASSYALVYSQMESN